MDVKLHSMKLVSQMIESCEYQLSQLRSLASDYNPPLDNGDDTLQKGDTVEVVDHFFDRDFNVIEKGWRGVIVDRMIPYIRVNFDGNVAAFNYERVKKV